MSYDVVRTGDKTNAYRVLVGKPEWRDSLEEAEVDCEKSVSEKSRTWDSVDWIDLAKEREEWRAVVNTVMNP
jgi:hypothetical protein